MTPTRTTLLVPAALCALAAAGFTVIRGSDAPPSETPDRPIRDGLATLEARPARSTAHAGARDFQVVGIMAQRRLAADSEYGEALPFMGTFAHTRIALEYTREGAGIVDLQREACKLTSLVDDRGTSLMPEEALDNPFEMLPSVAEDGSSLVFIVASKKEPLRGATRIDAAGEIAVLVASETATKTSAASALKKGAKLKVGPFVFEVESVGSSDWSDRWAITLQTKTDTSSIVRWALVDAAGVETELSPSSSWSGMGSYSQTVECDPAFESGALLLEYWSDAKVERIPFQVSAGIGL